jgi:hypothetical protein
VNRQNDYALFRWGTNFEDLAGNILHKLIIDDELSERSARSAFFMSPKIVKHFKHAHALHKDRTICCDNKYNKIIV